MGGPIFVGGEIDDSTRKATQFYPQVGIGRCIIRDLVCHVEPLKRGANSCIDEDSIGGLSGNRYATTTRRCEGGGERQGKHSHQTDQEPDKGPDMTGGCVHVFFENYAKYIDSSVG